MKSLMYYIRPHMPILCLQFFIKFTGTIMDLLLPWLLSYIIDDVVPKNNIKDVYFYGGLMVFFTLIGVTFNIVANRISIKTSRNITEKYRHDLFEKTAYLSSRSTDRFTIPSLISRLTSDTYNVHMMIDRMQRLGVRAPILLIGGIAVTMTLEAGLTLVLICTLPILAAVVFYVSKKGIGLYTQTQEATDGLVRKVQENMTGVRVIKALSKSEYEKRRFDETNIDLIKKDRKAQNLMAITNPTMNLLLNLGLTAVVVLGAYRVNAGISQPGKIIAFLSYFAIILNALLMVTRLFVIYSKGAASAKRIAEVLETPSETEFKPLETAFNPHFNAPKPASNGPQIEFKNVFFSYNGVRDNLSDISFTLLRGETLGIIGPTGSGKTTVINLLLRFYDADSGEIKIGGRDIKSIPREILHTKFGVVFQNDFLYADTIRENIDFGRSLDDEEIINAARAAQADFIYNKEGGFAHRLSVKGSNLSGGQKQRLLIARALAANPEILILDDCSSGLDYLTDAALRKALHSGFRDTTKVIIAQRISSIMNADKIMVQDDGGIIGYGTHAELLTSCESYREIYGAQMAEIG